MGRALSPALGREQGRLERGFSCIMAAHPTPPFLPGRCRSLSNGRRTKDGAVRHYAAFHLFPLSQVALAAKCLQPVALLVPTGGMPLRANSLQSRCCIISIFQITINKKGLPYRASLVSCNNNKTAHPISRYGDDGEDCC